jgi:methylated-DNA-[protein]-cysteine S-methyltransferase
LFNAKETKNLYFCNMVFTFHYDSPVGGLTIESNGLALTGLRFEMNNLHIEPEAPPKTVFYSGSAYDGIHTTWDMDSGEQRHTVSRNNPTVMIPPTRIDPVIEQTVRWLDRYFSGEAPGAVPPLSMDSTPFRKVVWETLLSIPYGETMSYGQVAVIVARQLSVTRMSAQAVGSAVGHNPIAIIIPCHRVIASDGSIGGFSAGLERKAWLLRHEGSVLFK